MGRLIYFVRHGQTDWNAEQRLQGQADTDLNDTGRAQAARNGDRLAALVPDASGFDFVASPMRRTRDTMEIMRGRMGLPRAGYRTDPSLVEVHFGDWQGFTFDELERDDPGCFARRQADKWRFVPPGQGAESYDTVARRIGPWLAAVEQDTICVTHGGVIRAVFLLAGGLGEAECAAFDVPQDRVLRLAEGRLDWL